jgi:hypothetical protein
MTRWIGLSSLALFLCSGCGEKKEAEVRSLAGDVSQRYGAGTEVLVPSTGQPEIETAPDEEWASEQIADEAKAALKSLVHHESRDGLAGDFKMASLKPTDLELGYQADGIEVSRGKAKEISGAGIDEFEAATEALFSVYLGGNPDYELFKIFRVQLKNDLIQTRIRFESAGVMEGGGRAQQRAEWQCEWLENEDGSLLLKSLVVEDFEEVRWRGSDSPWFANKEIEVLGRNSSWAGQLRHGLDFWLQRIEMFHGSFLGQRSGLAVGDVDGDGLDDLYVPQPSGLPNRLFLHQTDGTALDVSAESGADWLDFTSAALIVDLDNDGDGDLALATNSGIIILENTGGAKFVRRAVLKSVDEDVESLTAIDYDGDSDLDLFLCFDYAKAGVRRDELRGSGVLHNSSDGGANVLFSSGMTEGKGWRFQDVTRESGLDFKNRQHSLAAAWEDYDNDGDPDLYVSNDYGHNCLYQNEGGKFTEVAAAAGVVDAGPGMSASWSDYDRDGDMDLYVGNMFSSAGGRIFTQEKFRPWLAEEEKGLYRRFVKGNSMFENRGDGTFTEVGAERGVEIARWAWSSVFGDLNNDGWDDLVVANGYVTAPGTGDL